MNGTDIIILVSTIICVAGLICATIKRSKHKSKGCGGCTACGKDGCPFRKND